MSGLEAFIFSPTDGDSLDAEIAGLCRLALRGKACRWDEEHRNVLSCLTTEQLLAHWKLLPTFIELRIRRLGWLQCMAKNPANHIQEIGAIFCVTRMEKQEGYGEYFNDQGRLEEWASPWAWQAARDFDSLIVLDEGKSWLSDLDGRYSLVFQQGPLRDAFLNIDTKQLRAFALSKSIPPPGLAPDAEDQLQAQRFEDHKTTHYVCGICDADFSTSSKLQIHLRRAHDLHPLAAACCPTNACPLCETTFASRAKAYRHFSEALTTGICKSERSYSIRDRFLPKT